MPVRLFAPATKALPTASSVRVTTESLTNAARERQLNLGAKMQWRFVDVCRWPSPLGGLPDIWMGDCIARGGRSIATQAILALFDNCSSADRFWRFPSSVDPCGSFIT